MKKLGVIVIIYNSEKYLVQCIDSILNQTYKNIKLMLVDDGSTDGSGEICDRYAKEDARVQVIHQNNQGRLLARYNGLRNLECDYITFVDSDDWIALDIYIKLKEYMEKDIDVISFDMMRFYDEKEQYVYKNNYKDGFYTEEDIKKEIFPTMIWNIDENHLGLDASLCNKIIKREILFKEVERAKDLNICFGDDRAITYPMMLNVKSLQIVEHIGYYYRQRKRGAVPSYIKDKSFYKKLFKLYDYLIERMHGKECFVKQLDYYYTKAVGVHLSIYGKRAVRNEYLFPFNKVSNNKKIILYGAGTVGQTYKKQITKLQYATILLWVDRNSAVYESLGVKSLEYINDVVDYDYIVIAVSNGLVIQQIKGDLIKMGIKENKIVW